MKKIMLNKFTYHQLKRSGLGHHFEEKVVAGSMA
jgi:hypothetical protein